VVIAAAGCGSSDAPAPDVPSIAPSPSPHVPGGLVNGSRCSALRVQIQTNVSTLQLEEAAGHDAEVTKLKAQIAASQTAARAIPGCDVSDVLPR
jgi:hypothetical protein